MKILFLIILSCYAAITGANEVTTSTPEAIDFEEITEKKRDILKDIYEGYLSQLSSDEKRQLAEKMANALTPAGRTYAICITTENNDLLELCSLPLAKSAILEVIQKLIVNNRMLSVEDVKYLQRTDPLLYKLYNIQVNREKMEKEIHEEIYEEYLSQLSPDEKRQVEEEMAEEMANALTPSQKDDILAEKVYAIICTTENNYLLELCSSPLRMHHIKGAILKAMQQRINHESSVENVKYLQREVFSGIYNIQEFIKWIALNKHTKIKRKFD